jgi:hypothetical protein
VPVTSDADDATLGRARGTARARLEVLKADLGAVLGLAPAR